MQLFFFRDFSNLKKYLLPFSLYVFIPRSPLISQLLLVVWSLNARFEPDRDKADKSAKLCIQFPWDMSMKSEMGAQNKNFLLPCKYAVLGNHAFS